MALNDVNITDFPEAERFFLEDVFLLSRLSSEYIDHLSCGHSSNAICGEALSNSFRSLIETGDFSLSGQWIFNNMGKIPEINYRYGIEDIAAALEDKTKISALLADTFNKGQ